MSLRSSPSFVSLLVLLGAAPLLAAPATVRLQNGAPVGGATYAGFADATLLESAPEANAGGLPSLETGAAGAPLRRERAILRADLGGLAPSAIKAARLKVWFEGVASRTGNVGLFAQQRFHLALMRIPSSDAGWNAGTGQGRDPQTGAVSWAYRSYDPSRFEPGNARAGQARHLPWSSGAGLDQTKAEQTVAFAALPPGLQPGWVTFALPDLSVLRDGAGFVLLSLGAEGGWSLRFASSNSPDLASTLR